MILEIRFDQKNGKTFDQKRFAKVEDMQKLLKDLILIVKIISLWPS